MSAGVFAPLLVAAALALCCVARASAQATPTTPFLPNPCPSPYNPVPSLLFPEFYDSGYAQSVANISAASSPFNVAALTIAFWLNIAVTGAAQAATVVQYGDPAVPGAAGSHVNITWSTGDLMVFDTGAGEAAVSAGVCADATNACLVNQWHHWAFLYNYSAGTAIKSIWMNGLQVGFLKSYNPIAVSLSTPLLLGNQRASFTQQPVWSTVWMNSSGLSNHLPGYLAQFNVWQRQLTSDELTAIATLGLYTNNAALVLRYTFSEQTLATASDTGGSNLTLVFNKATQWFAHTPGWSGYFLQPLCLVTPTSMVPSGPSASPNCQAVNASFTVTVSVLDSAGALVTAFTGGSVSLVSGGGSGVSIAPSSAAFVVGVATFTVLSTVAQTLTLNVVDSGRLLLAAGSTTISVRNASGLYFASSTASVLQNHALTVAVYAGACSGLAVASGPFVPPLTLSLRSSAPGSHLSPQTTPLPLSISNSSGASVSLSNSFNEQVTFFLQDTSGRGLQAGANLTAFWTASTATSLILGTPYPGNGSQPSAGAFYAAVPIVVPVYAADSTGGPVAAFTGSATLTVVSPTGSYPHAVTLSDGAGYCTFTAKTPGAHVLTVAAASSSTAALVAVASVTVQVVGGLAVAVVFGPMNVTRVNVQQWTPLTVPLQVVDAYGNLATGFVGSFNVSSSSGTARINSVAAIARIYFTPASATAQFTFNETTSSTTPLPVTLFVNDTYGSGLNVSAAQLMVYVQVHTYSCAAGSVGSGALYFHNSAGVFENTGDLVNLGQADFSMSAWVWIVSDAKNYFASQAWYPQLSYGTSGATTATFYAGPEGNPQGLGVTFLMGWYTINATAHSWTYADYLWNSQFQFVGKWTHWAFVFQSSTQSMNIYYNGVLVAQSGGASWGTIAGQQPRGSWHLGIAPFRGSSNNNFWLDDLRVYLRPLSATEVWSMYAYNAYPNTQSLYMHYAFDEGSGLVYHDSVNHFDVPAYLTSSVAQWVGYMPNCLPTTTTLQIVAASSQRLDSPLLITLQGVDAFGNPSASYNGLAQLVVSGSSTAVLTPSSGVVTFSGGQAALQLTDTLPESVTLTLSDINSTGLVMGPPVVVQLFAGSLYKLVIVSAPSQQAGSGLGSLITIQCQDQYGNHVLQGCAGLVKLVHNATGAGSQPSPIVVALQSSSGSGTVTLVDSARETVGLSLLDDGLGVLVSSTAAFYSTAAPSAVVASNYTLLGGAVQATVDHPIVLALTVVDGYGTPCNFATAQLLVTLSSVTARGGGLLMLSAGAGALSISDVVAHSVLVSFSQAQLTAPYATSLLAPSPSLTIAFAVGATAQLAFTDTTWAGKPSALLLAGATAYVSVQAEDQFGNAVTAWSGSVNAVASASAAFWTATGALQQSLNVSLVAGAATLRLNDSSAETPSIRLVDAFRTGLSMPAALPVSFSSGACVKYAVASVMGSAYYDFPIVNPGGGAFTKLGAAGSDLPLNISQNVRITVQCQDKNGQLDPSVQGSLSQNVLILSATFSHNQTAVINGPCAFSNGSCFLYFQSFTGGNVNVTIVEAGVQTGLSLPAPVRVPFKQLVPIVWGVTPMRLTTDGSSITPQLITITGQGFMCYQNWSQAPVVQLNDPNTVPVLTTNCTVTFFNSTLLTCLLPAGQGKPEVIVSVCGVRQAHLPRWPTDAYFYVFGTAPDYCNPMQNWWDVDGHTWHDNNFCLKLGRALLDMRFYIPPGVGGLTLADNLPTNVTGAGAPYGGPRIYSYANLMVAYPNQPYYNVTTFPSVPAEVLVTHTCTKIEELLEPYNWPQAFLCLPKPAPYAWTLSRTGPLGDDSCVPIREGSDPYWSNGNHYMCTPPNTPYPDVDGIQMYYYQQPTIASVTPQSANVSGNVTLTLTGSSFGLNWTATAADNFLNTVTVGGRSCTINPQAYNHSYLECLLGPGEGQFLPIVLTVEGVAALNVPLFTFDQPVITSITPPSGDTQGGTLITLSGYNFGLSSATVQLGGAACVVQSYNNTNITCLTPAGIGRLLSVYVTTSLMSNAQPYLWSYNAPRVFTVSPANYDSAGGVTLTVAGSSFGASGAVAYVGGSLCPAGTAQNDTYLLCTLPGGQGANLNVTVVQLGQSSVVNAQFSYNAPVITGPPSPQGAASGVGQYILLTGLSFGLSGIVLVNGLVCDWTQGGTWAHHQIYCPLPVSSGSNVPVQVLVGGQQSNNVSFFYSPVIFAIGSNALYTQGGSVLTLYGVGFGQPAIVNDSVLVNGFANCSVLTQNETVLTCALPPGQGTQNSVTVGGLLALVSNAFAFAYSPPSISAQSPLLSPAAGGVNVTLQGTSFGFGNATSLTVNSLPCTLLKANHTALVFLAPAGSGLGKPLLVKVSGQTSAVWPFSYQAPNITAYAPTGGPTIGGYSLALWGSNFGGPTVNPVVSLGGVLVTILNRSDSFLNVTVPVGQGTVGLYVITDSQVSNAESFAYNPPTLSTISPSNASTLGGTYMTVTGASFGVTGAVYFYSTTSAAVVLCPVGPAGYNQSSVQCIIPAGQGTGWQVYLYSGGVQTATRLNFSYNAPTVTSLSPNSGVTDGGAIVTLHGSSFGTSGTVTVAGAPCLQAGSGTLYSDSLIQCQVAAGQGVNFPTTVLVSGQSFTSSTPSLAWSYSAPTVNALLPSSGPTTGQFVLTVLGTSFGSMAFVTFNASFGAAGAQNCTATGLGQSNAQITCLAPAGQGPSTPVYVSVSGQLSAPAFFAYNAPVITAVVPTLGSTAGTTVITLTGSNFGLGYNLSLTLNATAVPCTLVNNATLTFVMPRGVGVGLPLALVVASQPATASVSLLLSYSPPNISSVSSAAGGACTGTSGPVAVGCSIQGLTTDLITITGTNLGNSSAAINVTTGGLACTNVTVLVADSQLSCRLQAAPYGGVGVQVWVTVAGQSAHAPYLTYAGPVLLAGTLTALTSGSVTTSSGGINAVSAADPTLTNTTVTFQGTALSANLSTLSISYGPQGSAVKPFACIPVAAALLNGTSKLYAVNCTLTVGVGANLTFVIGVGQLTSAEGVDLLSYPPPSIVLNTIRLYGQAAAHSAPGSKNPGDQVLFDVAAVGTSSAWLSVLFGQAGGPVPLPNACTGVSLSQNASTAVWTVSCFMPQGLGSNATSYIFQLLALNAYSVVSPGQDYYTYPVSPVVQSVSGCAAQSGNATLGCPTYGGEYVIINGTSFSTAASDMSVRIGSSPCVDIVALSHSELLCLLEPGSGVQQPVTVTYSQLSSLPVPYLSYAPALMTRVSGCTDAVNATGGCQRAGGDTLTVYGSSFGSSAPLVLIGGTACLNVVLLEDDATQSRLQCNTPPGTGLALAIILVQAGGPVSVSPASVTLSYAPCPAGQFASATNSSCLPCPTGTYQDSLGSASCKQCAAGTVPASASGASACVACPAGSISAAGASLCSNCTAGYYTALPGSIACLSCGVGTFSAGSGVTACASCAPGSAQASLAQSSCPLCPSGQYASYAGAVSCSPCPAGTESTTGAGTNCTDCPAGSASAAQSPQCTPCGQGYYAASAHSSQCAQCDAGTFTPTSGYSACTQCMAGTYSAKGAFGCVQCSAGTYLASQGQSSCLSCPLGSYSGAAGASACAQCPPGSYSAQLLATVCQPCDAGSYAAVNGSVACALCAAGTYASVGGLSACSACSAGAAQSQVGAQACQPCDDGTATADTGQAACTACDSGSFSNSTGLPVCLQCPAGQFSSRLGGQGPQQCTPCPAGTFSATQGQDECQACPIGYFSSAPGAAACTQCPAGTSTTTVPGATQCTNCSAGTYSAQAGSFECVQCGAGTFAALQASTACTACPAGQAAVLPGSSACTGCDSGRYAASTGQSVCSVCDLGTFGGVSVNGSGLLQCTPCPAGSVAAAVAATSCTVCQAGSAQSAAGQATCVACTAGNYAPAPNATACLSCAQGSAAQSSSATACAPCTAGSFASGLGSAQCALCPAGSYSDSGSATSCTACSAGSYSAAAGASECTPCAAGSSATNTGAVQCTTCATGTFAPSSGAAACLQCPTGQYQAGVGALTCTACPNGTYTDTTGNGACASCPAGSIPDLNGATQVSGSTSCTQCAVGTYLTSTGVDTCLPCPAGTYAPVLGASTCLQCLPGSVNDASGASVCTQCPQGQYQPEGGQQTCAVCPAGSYADQMGEAVCTLCDLGSASNATGLNGACGACDAGYYQNQQGQQQCLPCPPGFQAPSYGALTCTACDAGYATADPGTVLCAECSPGTFQPNQSSTQCAACPIGSYSPTPHSQSCLLCPAGSFANVTGLSACFLCPAGAVQPQTGASSCALCSEGQYQQAAGQTACTLCSTGQFAAVNGSAQCQPCAEGHYQDAEGATDCSPCPLGTSIGVQGQPACQQCAPGSMGNDTGLTQCFACDAGSLQTQPGQWRCDECAEGQYQPSLGQSACLLCASGGFSNATGASACTPCAEGSIQPVQGQTACGLCPPGGVQRQPRADRVHAVLRGPLQPLRRSAELPGVPRGPVPGVPGLGQLHQLLGRHLPDGHGLHGLPRLLRGLVRGAAWARGLRVVRGGVQPAPDRPKRLRPVRHRPVHGLAGQPHVHGVPRGLLHQRHGADAVRPVLRVHVAGAAGTDRLRRLRPGHVLRLAGRGAVHGVHARGLQRRLRRERVQAVRGRQLLGLPGPVVVHGVQPRAVQRPAGSDHVLRVPRRHVDCGQRERRVRGLRGRVRAAAGGADGLRGLSHRAVPVGQPLHEMHSVLGRRVRGHHRHGRVPAVRRRVLPGPAGRRRLHPVRRGLLQPQLRPDGVRGVRAGDVRQRHRAERLRRLRSRHGRLAGRAGDLRRLPGRQLLVAAAADDVRSVRPRHVLGRRGVGVHGVPVRLVPVTARRLLVPPVPGRSADRIQRGQRAVQPVLRRHLQRAGRGRLHGLRPRALPAADGQRLVPPVPCRPVRTRDRRERVQRLRQRHVRRGAGADGVRRLRAGPAAAAARLSGLRAVRHRHVHGAAGHPQLLQLPARHLHRADQQHSVHLVPHRPVPERHQPVRLRQLHHGAVRGRHGLAVLQGVPAGPVQRRPGPQRVRAVPGRPVPEPPRPDDVRGLLGAHLLAQHGRRAVPRLSAGHVWRGGGADGVRGVCGRLLQRQHQQHVVRAVRPGVLLGRRRCVLRGVRARAGDRRVGHHRVLRVPGHQHGGQPVPHHVHLPARLLHALLHPGQQHLRVRALP